jgi:nucleotidyltransferase/DNA polymerase involved in DNA repair
VSILYCTIPHFAVALARQEHPALSKRPLVLLGAEERVVDASAEAVDNGVTVGSTAQMAQACCPEAQLLEADLVRCRERFEELLDLLEQFSPVVEPRGFGTAYVDLGDAVRARSEAIALCSESGQVVRQALGVTLQPALGWDRSKFTAQAAAQYTRPGRVLAVDADREHDFLGPLPVTLLPLDGDTLQRLAFLGLHTLGQYAALPAAAVWQQFGRAGRRAQSYARGEDRRPVISRHRLPVLTANRDLDGAYVERERLLAILGQMAGPLLAELRENVQACGQVCLCVRFDDGSAEEKRRVFLPPTAEDTLIERALSDLIGAMHWPAGAIALSISLEQIQEAAMEQLRLFPDRGAPDCQLRPVLRYLAARFGASRLWRTAIIRPDAPLAEWRVSWQREEEE